MIDKLTSLEQAAELVAEGATLGLGGMTIYRRPAAFVRALLRRPTPPANLTLLGMTLGLESDLFVGAGLVRRVRSCYFGLESFGLAPMFTEKAGRGELEIIEETELSIALGLRARLAGVGFMPGLGWIGTDMLALRPDVKTVVDPYSGETLVAYPAIACDVAAIHALVADREGNARLGGNPTIDGELSLVAPVTIITAERVVDRLDADADIAAPAVTAVVHAPRGAWPTSCYPEYPIDGGEILRYIEMCNAGRFYAYRAELMNR